MTARSSTSAGRRVPIIDLGKEYLALKPEIDAVLEKVLSSGSYILGRETENFEKSLATFCQVKHAAGVNSGTDALLIAYRALGIGPGDEVILPAMTFIATAEPVAALGATPVFADIDPVSYTLDPKAVQKKISRKTKAIVAVHLYGLAADLKALQASAETANAALVEDMAQAIGAAYDGHPVGGFGQIACLSFFPTKNLGACGDAGAVLTGSAELDQRVRSLRNHGASIKYQHDEIGYNSRLDELQAAILSIKLRHLDAWNDQRRILAKEYGARLEGLPLALPQEISGRRHIFHLYSVRTPKRDGLRSFLGKRGIATGLHYPAPLHLQRAFRSLGCRPGDFPNSERLAAETLSLPLFPHMTMDDVEYVSAAVREFFKSA